MLHIVCTSRPVQWSPLRCAQPLFWRPIFARNPCMLSSLKANEASLLLSLQYNSFSKSRKILGKTWGKIRDSSRLFSKNSQPSDINGSSPCRKKTYVVAETASSFFCFCWSFKHAPPAVELVRWNFGTKARSSDNMFRALHLRILYIFFSYLIYIFFFVRKFD